MGTCRIVGCDRPIKIKKDALCGLHYARLRRHGDPTAWKRPRRPICGVDGCDLRAAARGLCDKHYRRLRRYGSVEAPVRPVICAIAGCGRNIGVHGLCDRHYRRSRLGEVERRCTWCAGPIDPNAHFARRYCSDECREKELYVRRRRDHRRTWLRKYGLTIEQYDTLLASQDHRCAICRTDEVPARGSWYVDHCHATGSVRGLLCMSCNAALGHFRDDPEILEAAVRYLAVTCEVP